MSKQTTAVKAIPETHASDAEESTRDVYALPPLSKRLTTAKIAKIEAARFAFIAEEEFSEVGENERQ